MHSKQFIQISILFLIPNFILAQNNLEVVGDTIILKSADDTKTIMMRTEGASGEVKSIGDLYLRGQNSNVIINHVNTDANVGIGTIMPLEKLHVIGNGLFEGDEFQLLNSDGIKNISLRTAGADGELRSTRDLYLRSIGNDVLINHVASDGNVGIGTNAPIEKLHVMGDIKASGDKVYVQSADLTKEVALTTSNAVPELISNQDLSIRSAGSNILINTTTGDGDVAIGAISPLEKLHVNGGIYLGNTTSNNSGSIRFTGTDFEGNINGTWTSFSQAGAAVWSLNGIDTYYNTGEVGIGTANPTSRFHVIGSNDTGETVDITTTGDLLANADVLNLAMGAQSSDDAQFLECRRFADLMFRVDGDGTVAVGNGGKTIIDGATGDVYVTEPTAGIILTSPNGNCWRITIDDTGTQVVTSVTCP